MEDLNLKFTMQAGSNYTNVEKPPMMNSWIGDTNAALAVGGEVLQPQQNQQHNVGGDYAGAKTWADMVKKSGNCSSGETRFCVAPNIDYSNGMKTPNNDKRRSIGGRFSAEKGKGPKNNYRGSGNSPPDTYNNNNYKMNHFLGDRAYYNRPQNYKSNGMNANDRSDGNNGYPHQRKLLSNSNSPNNKYGSDTGTRGVPVSTSIVPMASLQQQFVGMSLAPSVTMPPPGIFQPFSGTAPRMFPPGGTAYMPVENSGFPGSYVFAHTTNGALFPAPSHVQSQPHIGIDNSHPPHQMTTTQQLHLLHLQHQHFQQQQQQIVAMMQQQQHQQQQQGGAVQHVVTPQQITTAIQQHPQMNSQNGQRPQQTQPTMQQIPQQQLQSPPQMQTINSHPQQQSSQAQGQSQAPAPPPSMAHPQFFIPFSTSNGTAIPAQNGAVMYPQPLVPMSAIGRLPPPLICAPQVANNNAAVPSGSVNDANGGGNVFVPPFQEEKFVNTWLQNDCVPSIQLVNERAFQNYVWTHNNTVAINKERNSNGKDNNQPPPNLLASVVYAMTALYPGGNSSAAKLFPLK